MLEATAKRIHQTTDVSYGKPFLNCLGWLPAAQDTCQDALLKMEPISMPSMLQEVLLSPATFLSATISSRFPHSPYAFVQQEMQALHRIRSGLHLNRKLYQAFTYVSSGGSARETQTVG